MSIVYVPSGAYALHDRYLLSSLPLCIVLPMLVNEEVLRVLRIVFKLVLALGGLVPVVEELVEFLKLGRHL